MHFQLLLKDSIRSVMSLALGPLSESRVACPSESRAPGPTMTTSSPAPAASESPALTARAAGRGPVWWPGLDRPVDTVEEGGARRAVMLAVMLRSGPNQAKLRAATVRPGGCALW